MNRVIRFYNYEQCFAHYTKRIKNIRQAKIHGERNSCCKIKSGGCDCVTTSLSTN